MKSARVRSYSGPHLGVILDSTKLFLHVKVFVQANVQPKGLAYLFS